MFAHLYPCSREGIFAMGLIYLEDAAALKNSILGSEV